MPRAETRLETYMKTPAQKARFKELCEAQGTTPQNRLRELTILFIDRPDEVFALIVSRRTQQAAPPQR
jgi:hypothetical protein